MVAYKHFIIYNAYIRWCVVASKHFIIYNTYIRWCMVTYKHFIIYNAYIRWCMVAYKNFIIYNAYIRGSFLGGTFWFILGGTITFLGGTGLGLRDPWCSSERPVRVTTSAGHILFNESVFCMLKEIC